MANVLAPARDFLRGEEGATIVEYALTLVLVLAVSVGAIAALGSGLSTLFVAVATSV